MCIVNRKGLILHFTIGHITFVVTYLGFYLGLTYLNKYGSWNKENRPKIINPKINPEAWEKSLIMSMGVVYGVKLNNVYV